MNAHRASLAYRRSHYNDPPWGSPMTTPEYDAVHPAWCDRLRERFGFVSVDGDQNQCGGCRFYMPIDGDAAADWGACGNPASDRCGHTVFEHHGCRWHSEGESA